MNIQRGILEPRLEAKNAEGGPELPVSSHIIRGVPQQGPKIYLSSVKLSKNFATSLPV